MIKGRERPSTKRERTSRRKTKAGEWVTAGMIEKISCRMEANSQSNKGRCWGGWVHEGDPIDNRKLTS